MEKRLVQLSKQISYVLRHEPWLYELELDEEGWVPLEELIDALTKSNINWQGISEKDITLMIEQSEKKRHEIFQSKIRALYGHSIPGKLVKENRIPPEFLYHGTSSEFIDEIIKHGLLPMNRQYVHLSVDVGMAKDVGKRKSKTPIILTIKASLANKNGINFYRGNELVWLADQIPPSFICF